MVSNGINTALCGYFNGSQWDADKRKNVVKKGKVGDKFTLGYSLSISKGKGDDKVYGLGIPVTIWIEDKDKAPALMEKISSGKIVMEGYFSPNNWEKEGKQIKGHQFNVDSKNIFTEDEYKLEMKNRYSEEQLEAKENPWKD